VCVFSLLLIGSLILLTNCGTRERALQLATHSRIEDGDNLSMSKRELKSLLAGSSDVPTRKSRLRGSNRDLTMNEGTQVEAETGLEELRSELVSRRREAEAKDMELLSSKIRDIPDQGRS